MQNDIDLIKLLLNTSHTIPKYSHAYNAAIPSSTAIRRGVFRKMKSRPRAAAKRKTPGGKRAFALGKNKKRKKRKPDSEDDDDDDDDDEEEEEELDEDQRNAADIETIYPTGGCCSWRTVIKTYICILFAVTTLP